MQLFICVTLAWLLFLPIANSQVYTLQGTVMDRETSNPLPFATITVKKGQEVITGTHSDLDGNFRLLVSYDTIDLEVAFTGYAIHKYSPLILINDSILSLDVFLSSEITALEEVVVTAYRVPLVEQDNLTSAGNRSTTGQKNRPHIHLRGSRVSAPIINTHGVPKSGGKAPFTPSTEDYSPIEENDYKQVTQTPVSTFSIDVDNASYSNVRRLIRQGHTVPPDAVRLEEMINYFEYNYPQARKPHPFSFTTELGTCPWNPERQLLHIGIQGKKPNYKDLPPSSLVFLLDVSGSMNSPNKLPLLKQAFQLLVQELRPEDQVAVVIYASGTGLVLPPTPGHQKETILQALEQLKAGGATAGAAGIQLAYSTAEKAFLPKGNNRIILATDGDFNLGVSSDGELTRLIEKKREKGIFLTTLGFGTGNYKDNKLELLANKGNGNYFYIDGENEARKVFVRELRANLFTIAKDVKVQIEFNPVHVKSYRLVGYENRLLNREDFDNDQKDAGELGAGHAVTALYEIEWASSPLTATALNAPLRYQGYHSTATAHKSGELALLRLRYKKPDREQSILVEHPVAATRKANLTQTDHFLFSAAVAAFGLWLRQSDFNTHLTPEEIINLAHRGKGKDPYGDRQEFIQLVEQAALEDKAR